MPISVEDVKLMASQRLADTDDGGGRMTGNEIVDGNVNNLFPDISRLDRVYGRVSLRKAFISVQTADNDTYNGAHVILSVPAQDPNVSVCLFTTSDPNDERTAARDRIESYVVKGPRFPGWLWGNHPAGSRSLLIFAIKGTAVPSIGDVLYLTSGSGQYVRITSVEATKSDFYSTSESTEYGSQALAFSRDIFKIEIGDPLRETQTGVEISKNDTVATTVYSTTVYDAAKYYGVMLPTAAISSGDIALNVDSIFTHLVPSAQGESPLVDLSIGEAGPVVGSGEPYSVSKSITVANNVQINFGRGIKPATLTLTGGGHTYTDPGEGILYEGTAQRGSIDYGTGTITFANVTGYTATMIARAVIGTEATRISNTASRPVVLANQGYNYTAILDPLPSPNTVMVDYMSQGKWYRLRDDGIGTLVPDIDSTGTGTINYATGSIILTCAALPDVDSSIMYIWGAPIEVEDMAGEVVLNVAEVVHQVTDAPIDPGSLVITWPSGQTTATVTDDGNGALTGAATGSVNYSTGKIRWKPTLSPESGSVYTLEYEKYPVVTASVAGAVVGGVATFTLPSAPIVPGTCNVSVMVTFNGDAFNTYELVDDGEGVLSALGTGTIGAPLGYLSESFSFSGLAGTIDYTTGVVQMNLASATGIKTVYLYEYQQLFDGTWTGRYSWVQRYKGKENTILTGAGISGSANCRYTLTSAAADTAEETAPALPFSIDLLPTVHGKTIIPGSVNFVWGGVRYIDRLGKVYRNPDPATGQGVEVGSIDYTTGLVTINTYDAAANTISLQSLLVRFGRQFLPSCSFRTPGAPLRPGSLQIQGVAADGRAVGGTSNFDGTVTGALLKGVVNYDTGIVELAFGEMVAVAGNENETWYDPDAVEDGQIWKPLPVVADQLTYACVVYSYIPLDADLIGIDPVRLPADGRVPIVKSGDVVVVHNTQASQLPNPVTAGLVLTFTRTGINHVELYDANEVYVPSTFYSWSEPNQQLTLSNPLDLSAYTQPLFAMHRVEDMCLVSQVQINGQIIVAQGVLHDYPAAGTYVSSALLFGDLQSRYYNLYDQKTWTNVWSDSLIGDAANASYNEINYPLVVTNEGSVKGRWALIFDGSDHFNINEEKLGIVGSGYITQDCQPINPATQQPFFFIDYRGWGTGWASGNVLRFNTDGANADFWIARTTLQGPVTEPNDQFTLQIRGDAE